VVAAALAGGFIGLALGALGGGGAVLAVPALVYLAGQDAHTATTTSLVVVSVAATAGAIGQADRGQVCWPQVAVFVPAAALASVAGTVANEAVAADVLLVSFACVMLAAAAFTWWKVSSRETGPRAACPPLRATRTAGAGLAIGGLTGFLGVGGGFLVVPMLAFGLRFPLRRAIGTSLVVVAVVSFVGLAAHLAQGERSLDAAVTVAMAATCATGAIAGMRFAPRLPERVLGRAFAGVVALTAVYVLFETA
jgi:uncharacterized membrane protein YfcA